MSILAVIGLSEETCSKNCEPGGAGPGEEQLNERSRLLSGRNYGQSAYSTARNCGIDPCLIFYTPAGLGQGR